jgi:hypothetical protein
MQEMIAARTDVWGDAAMRQPNGASYEFFKDLMPPVRWTNAEFKHYPIVLSAPQAVEKVRVISNGSAVNARANKAPMWFEQGLPVAFFVGEGAEPFGEDLARLETPTYLDGYLPVVAIKFKQDAVNYQEEVFAPVDEKLAAHGAAMLRFSIADREVKRAGRVEARIATDKPIRVQDQEVLNDKGESLLAFSDGWNWQADRKALVAQLTAGHAAELLVFTKPTSPGTVMSATIYDRQRQECVDTWKDLLKRSIKLETPEAIVNDAWRALLIGNFMIAVGDRPHYSAGNAYNHLYEGECGDTMRSVMLFGHLDTAAKMLKPMLEFWRPDTRYHVAGQKLQLLSHFYWVTRDAKTVREYEPLWRKPLQLILSDREKQSGLMPKDNYAGDIHTQVYSLNSSANCWRGLRDLAAVLDDTGSKEEAAKLRETAAEFHKAIMRAVEKSERRDAKPLFIPVSLLNDEPAHDPLTDTRTGSYYDLICPYIIGSEVFGQGSEREDALLGYMQQHGGIAMGMPRTRPAQGQFQGQNGVVPLYALRYSLALLRRDEREKALVGFYGHLAHGLTRGTFIGGEGCRFEGGDENGRGFYLPPNSTSNAVLLITLRNLLVQDWDLDGDAKPETLRLMFAAPRRWLADGKQIRIDNAPTSFGRVSCRVESKLDAGYVEAQVTPPAKAVKTMLLRAPVPGGWCIESAQVDGQPAKLKDANTVDLSGRTKPIKINFAVKPG